MMPEPKIVTVTNTIQTVVPIVNRPKQVQLNDIKIYVVSAENFEEFKKIMIKRNKDIERKALSLML